MGQATAGLAFGSSKKSLCNGKNPLPECKRTLIDQIVVFFDIVVQKAPLVASITPKRMKERKKERPIFLFSFVIFGVQQPMIGVNWNV
jgi:hypothetical protein